MRINFTLFGAGLTGGTFNIVEVANRLAMRGHKITITSIGGNKDLEWFYKRKKAEFKAIFAPLTNKLSYRFFRRLARGTKIFPMPESEIRDLISVMPECEINIATAAPTVFAVYRSNKGNGFYYVQHYDSLFGNSSTANRMHDESYFLPLQKITVSSWLAKTIKAELNINTKAVVTAGIDETVFYPRQKTKKSKKRIISLGRKVEWKGFGDLQAAMRELFKIRSDMEWVIYSSHDTPVPTASAPFRLVKSPYGKDLAELYASGDIVVNPSWHEGFAQPALEAMACGSAVITTPIGAEDFMEPDKNCLVIESKNPRQLKNMLERLLDDDNLRAKLIEGGLKKSKEFWWDRIINKWENVLK